MTKGLHLTSKKAEKFFSQRKVYNSGLGGVLGGQSPFVLLL